MRAVHRFMHVIRAVFTLNLHRISEKSRA